MRLDLQATPALPPGVRAAIAQPAIVQREIPGHVLENIGTADCRLVMFEPA